MNALTNRKSIWVHGFFPFFARGRLAVMPMLAMTANVAR